MQPHSPQLVEDLKARARLLRRHIVQMVGQAGSGHPAGSLSAADVITALYFHQLRHDPRNPGWPDRDRFILSKGHCSPALYSALAEAGYFPVEDLATFRKFGSHLQGHPDRLLTPGVEMTTGSLGQGFSVALGIALAGKLDRAPWRVYVMLGDGESQEGQVWEAAMFAAYRKLDNVTAVLDRNRMQNDGPMDKILDIEPGDNARVTDKWRAFGWHVIEIDGHDMVQILDALDASLEVKGRPTMIVAHTVKGKGVSFMENNPDFHGKAPTPEQVEQALRELAG